jgi:hypothetical protein
MRGSVTVCTRNSEGGSSIAPRNINLDVSLVANRLEGGAWKYRSEINDRKRLGCSTLSTDNSTNDRHGSLYLDLDLQ